MRGGRHFRYLTRLQAARRPDRHMALVFGRTCIRPVVTAITQTSQAQPTTAQLHSLSQVHVRSVACSLRIWHARSQHFHLKHTAQGCRAVCSASHADVPQDTRRKIVFLGTPEVITYYMGQPLLCYLAYDCNQPHRIHRSQQMFCSSFSELQDCLSPLFRYTARWIAHSVLSSAARPHFVMTALLDD